MKKALLYSLLFVLLTIVVVFVLIFGLPFLIWPEGEGGGHGNNIFDTFPLLLPSLSVIVWSLVTLFVFIKNRYADVSFGKMAKNDIWKFVLLGGLSVVLLKTALQPMLWIMNTKVSESRYTIIQMWMQSDVLVMFLLTMIHITLEAVVFSAILRELIIWSRRPFIAITVVAFICTLPNFTELSASQAVPFVCAFIPVLYSGWLYYRTGSIWPTVLGMVVYDALLLFTPVFEYISFALVSAVILPWTVIFLSKTLLKKVEPVTSR